MVSGAAYKGDTSAWGKTSLRLLLPLSPHLAPVLSHSRRPHTQRRKVTCPWNASGHAKLGTQVCPGTKASISPTRIKREKFLRNRQDGRSIGEGGG